jgi:hypothetical protein
MATEFSSDGENGVYNGALIYIRRVETNGGVERYRIQIYRDNLPGHKFWSTYEDGTLEHAQQFAIQTADWMAQVPPEKPIELICPTCAATTRVTQEEIDNARGCIYCDHHVGSDVMLITMAEFDEMVQQLVVHPDDFEPVGV